MFKLLPLLILIAQFFYTSPSYSVGIEKGQQKLLSEISVLTDETNQKKLAEIIEMEGEFETFIPPFSGGFTRAANWFRIVIQRTADAPEELVISAGPAFLNNLRFYSADNNQNYKMQQAGDQFSQKLRLNDKLYGAYSFVINISDTLPHTYYLRLQTRSTSTLNISILSATAAIEQNLQRKLILGILLGALFLVFIHTIFMWKQIQHPSFIAFIGHLVTIAICLVLIDGYWYQYLMPDCPELLTFSGPFVMWGLLFFINLFFIYFFDTYHKFTVLHKLFCLVLVIVTLNLLSAPLGYYTFVAPIAISISLFITFPIQIYVSWKSKNYFIDGSQSIFYGVIIYFFCFGLTLLTALGFLSLSASGIVNFQMGILVCLIFMGLQKRYKSMLLLQQKSKIRVEVVEKLTEMEKQRSKEKSIFLNSYNKCIASECNS